MGQAAAWRARRVRPDGGTARPIVVAVLLPWSVGVVAAERHGAATGVALGAFYAAVFMPWSLLLRGRRGTALSRRAALVVRSRWAETALMGMFVFGLLVTTPIGPRSLRACALVAAVAAVAFGGVVEVVRLRRRS